MVHSDDSNDRSQKSPILVSKIDPTDLREMADRLPGLAPTTISSARSLSAPFKPLRDHKPKKLSLKNSQQLVTLFAAAEEQKFVVHKEFACHYSPVLKAAFNSQFMEGQTQEYRLRDTTKEALHQLVHWFYFQKLDTMELTEKNRYDGPENYIEERMAENIILAKTWVLADKLLIGKLQDQIIDEIVRIRDHSHLLSSSVLKYVYDNTPEGSPLRRLYVDLFVRYGKPRRYESKSDRYPKEMLFDVVSKFSAVIPTFISSTRTPSKDLSLYHVADN
ncbi:hypothetical protein MBM_04842 [Drepanopeziza brunnea f. sp. 'multigermtubi' MB_m1]|uniref:BTB domain-containing protein n=1 Tax=Marssonina brunnea f. sp. multigermtubi (strain MB_m1) TaxID=1072389 RepID=K1WI44_MARBU|nr:uncharacterized protein MBM_04842 [Drepanopeziza brunnea f. sp. 'multigermtubi' MB_m1]EKD17265.1 hypothetical protein MBM_04842 [Drepanopeziza brunnea f. sp. 'multigermtubi' MB_m1]